MQNHFQRITTLTFTLLFSLCYFTNCGKTERKISDEEVEIAAQQQFNALKDTLTVQFKADCESSLQNLVQNKVDSIIFEYYKNDSTATTLTE